MNNKGLYKLDMFLLDCEEITQEEREDIMRYVNEISA